MDEFLRLLRRHSIPQRRTKMGLRWGQSDADQMTQQTTTKMGLGQYRQSTHIYMNRNTMKSVFCVGVADVERDLIDLL